MICAQCLPLFQVALHSKKISFIFSLCFCALCLMLTIALNCFTFWNFFFHFWFVLLCFVIFVHFLSLLQIPLRSEIPCTFFHSLCMALLWCVDSGSWTVVFCDAWYCGFGHWNFCAFMLSDLCLVLTFALSYFVL